MRQAYALLLVWLASLCAGCAQVQVQSNPTAAPAAPQATTALLGLPEPAALPQPTALPGRRKPF